VETLLRDFETLCGASRLPEGFRGRALKVFADMQISPRWTQASQTPPSQAVNEQSRRVPGPSRRLGSRREEGRRPQGRQHAGLSRLSAVASPTAECRKPGLEPQLCSRLGKPFGYRRGHCYACARPVGLGRVSHADDLGGGRQPLW
jgi:hypothetical protein